MRASWRGLRANWKGLRGHLSGSEGQPGEIDGWTNRHTDKQNFSSFYRTSSPVRAAGQKRKEEIGEREVLYIHQLTTSVTSDIFELDSRSCAQMVAPKNILSLVPISVILHEVLSLRTKENMRKHATIESD